MKYLISARARADMLDIWSYIARDNNRAADELISDLRRTMQNLAEQPAIGRIRAELSKSLYYFPCENYLIFYQPMQYGVRIIRVLHSARYTQSLL